MIRGRIKSFDGMNKGHWLRKYKLGDEVTFASHRKNYKEQTK